MDEKHSHNQKHKPKWKHAEYLQWLLPSGKRAQTARLAKRALKKFDYDALACRGVSGLLLAPMLASRLKKSLIVVRKPGEDNHSGRMVEGDVATRRYIIIDDFIHDGDTVKAIKTAIDNFAPEAVCLGVLEVNKLHRKVGTHPSSWHKPGPPEGATLRVEWMNHMKSEAIAEAARIEALRKWETEILHQRLNKATKPSHRVCSMGVEPTEAAYAKEETKAACTYTLQGGTDAEVSVRAGDGNVAESTGSGNNPLA